MERKAQAAMEFLMTYGWAILAAIVVIGALGTYFYFRTGTTDSAFVNPPLYALGSAISTGSGVQLELKNNGADDITITSVAITPKTTGVTCTADATSTPVPAGNATTRTVGCLGRSEEHTSELQSHV